MEFEWNKKKSLARIGLALAYLIGLIPFIPFVVDDAFISFVYSKNIALGNGLTYNGVLVEGYSNPLWTLVFIPFAKTGIDPLVIARSISILSGLLCILLLFQLALDLAENKDLTYPFLGTLSISVLAPWLAWTLGGLETIFLSALIVLLVYVEWFDHWLREVASPFLITMIAFTRPEGILVFVVWLIYRCFFSSIKVKQTVIESLVFLLLFLTMLVTRWQIYGTLLPNTAYVKVHPGIAVSLDALKWLLSFISLRPFFGVLLLLGITVIFIQKPFNSKLILPLGITLGFVAFVIFSGRDWMPHHRFITPIIPLLVLPIVSIQKVIHRPIHNRMVILLFVIVIGFEFYMDLYVYKPVSEEFGLFTGGLINAGKWINKNTDEGEVIAVVDAGALAYYSERPTIDILGLNDVQIASSKGNMDIDYVLDHQPRIIQLHAAYSDTGELFPPTDTEHNLSMLENQRFLACYRPDLHPAFRPLLPLSFFPGL